MNSQKETVIGMASGVVIISIIIYEFSTFSVLFFVIGAPISLFLTLVSMLTNRYSEALGWGIIGIGVPACGYYIGGRHGMVPLLSFLAGACIGYALGFYWGDQTKLRTDAEAP